MSFHYFILKSKQKVLFKTTNNDTEFLGTFKYQCNQEPCKYEKSDFVSCLYDNLWWIGISIKIDEAEMDCAIKFLNPPGPITLFYWPARADICRITFSSEQSYFSGKT